jgi:hypothetical protein
MGGGQGGLCGDWDWASRNQGSWAAPALGASSASSPPLESGVVEFHGGEEE